LLEYIKEVEIGEACSTQGGNKIYIEIIALKFSRKRPLERHDHRQDVTQT
jgi:hypothetical protein